jgi:pimeloyl-ACP methyl ester carboxylesterase
MPQVQANGIRLEYESYGSAARETVLLIQGLGAQLIHWPLELCHEMVARGYRVVRFDNRDIGLSSKLEGDITPAMLMSLAMGQPDLRHLLPYTLEDMARDAVELLAALQIERAHVAGASMGGMIAQLVAAGHPERTLSLTSIMSSSGRRDLPGPTPAAQAALLAPFPPADDLPAVVERGVRLRYAIAGAGYPTPDEEIRRQSLVTVQRSYYPAGMARQYAAVLASGDRRPKLERITAPTVVLHGEDDPLIPVEAAVDTAESIPGAELRVVPGWGHDFPLAVVPQIADAICAAANRAAVSGQQRA